MVGGSSAIPPRELNVWKFLEARAPEIGSLHGIVSGRLNNDFRSRRNKRRRTAGHDDRCRKRGFRKRRKVDGEDFENGHSSGEKGEKTLSRRIRRRIELKKNPESGFVNSGDGTKRLRTHVWYAKRFTMSKLWGFHLPLGLHGKGRGSRALLKKLKKSVLLHDASYHGCIQLEGPQDTLLLLMNSILVPSPSPSQENLSGAVFRTAMLHDIGKSNHPPIAPVTLMWRPGDVEGVLRCAWIWAHASAFEEAFRSLCSACERMRDESRSVSCVSLEGRFGKLELMGLKAIPLLQKILKPANRSWHLKKCSNDEIHSATIFEGGCRVIPLVVNDPRLVIQKDDEVLPDEECNAVDKFEYTDLWEISKGLYPPMEESVLSMERHNRRKEFFRIGRKSSQPKMDGFSVVCPVSVSIDGHHEDSVSRCSVVLPLSWVKAFWNTLISCGAHAIGLREKRWVSSELGLPIFPWDFPDCPAYSRFMEMEADLSSQKTSLAPPSRRPPEVPIPPPWNCLRRDDDGGPFEFTVARTAAALFPKLREEDGRKLGEEETQPCYLRVALRAYREGAFEEGAVVCSPHVSDIALWTAENPEGEGLQLPRGTLSSYFTKLGSGEWRIGEVPDGRRPIGFVTSGFVRGSRTANAVAICEAGFLSKLRREQCGEGSPENRRRREEIFVLVRNLRSTAYRLAVAAVVLEDKEDDVEFM